MKRLFPLFCIALACRLMAAEPTLVNGDFEMGKKGWELPDCAKFESFAGHEGTTALILQRQTPKSQPEAVEQYLHLQPDGIYTLEVWMKSIDLKGGAVQFFMRFFDQKDKPLDRYEKCLKAPTGTFDWTNLILDFTVPHDTATCQLSILLPPQAIGTVFLDKLSIRRTNRPFSMALIHPAQGTLDAERPLFRIAIVKPGAANLSEALMNKTLRITWNGHQSLRAAQPVVEMPLERPLEAPLMNLKVELLDLDSQRVDATLQTTLQTQPRQQDNACRIDARQRAIVDGRTFFPVGLVLDQALPTAVPPLLKASPFNCVALTTKAVSGISSFEELQTTMDAWKQCGMRVIFPMTEETANGNVPWPWYTSLAPSEELRRERLVPQVAALPALLAWQLPASVQPTETARRQLNRIDSAHPVLKQVDGARIMAEYHRDGDLLGLPIAIPQNKEDSRTLARTLQTLDELAQTHLGSWVVLRIPSDGSATPETLQAMTLLLAMHGVRGVFFAPTPQERDIDAIPWEMLSEQATLLNELSPFLLSNIPSREVPLRQKKGEAMAREFMDTRGNRVVLLIGGLKAGKTETLITFPKNATPVSRFGATRQLRNGNWCFIGKGICYDLIEIRATGDKDRQ